MPLEFIDLNSPHVECDNRKAMGKGKWYKTKFDNQQKLITQSLEKKRTKWKSNFKSMNVSSYSGKNWKLITLYLIIVTVIIEIIVKMTVMLMNKDNNI